MTSKYLNKQLVYIDSDMRCDPVNETHSNFTYTIDLLDEVDQVVCLFAAIKKSYYLIQSGRNFFTLVENGVNITITVPEGNYGATSFRTVLAALLTAASLNGWVYTITIPNSSSAASTGKFTFTSSAGNPSFVFTEYLYEQCGFEPNSTNTFVSNTLTSDNIVNFQAEDVLHIHSDLVGEGKDNILQIVSATGSDFSSLKYSCIDVEANSRPFTYSKTKKNKFSFMVANHHHQLINLDLSWVSMLMFYKKNTLIDNLCQMQMDVLKLNKSKLLSRNLE